MAWKTLPPATRANVVKELHDDDIEFIRSKVYTAYSDMRGVEYDGHGIRLRAVQDRVKILRALRSEDPYRSNKQERDRLEMYLDCLEKMLPNLMGDVRFYGSNDGKDWKLISEEKGVKSMNVLNPIQNFSVAKVNKCWYSSYMFRCHQNWSKKYPEKFFLSKLEFFGKIDYK